MRYIRLTEDFDLGRKVAPSGSIQCFDRATMNRLVKEGKAYYCSKKGLRLPTPPHLIDEEE